MYFVIYAIIISVSTIVFVELWIKTISLKKIKNIVECSRLEAIFLFRHRFWDWYAPNLSAPYPTQRVKSTRPLTRRVWRLLSGGIIKRKKTSRERANRRRNWRRRRGSKGARQPRAPLPPTQRVVRRGRWTVRSGGRRSHWVIAHLWLTSSPCLCATKMCV